jgi:hypothetical protein
MEMGLSGRKDFEQERIKVPFLLAIIPQRLQLRF